MPVESHLIQVDFYFASGPSFLSCSIENNSCYMVIPYSRNVTNPMRQRVSLNTTLYSVSLSDYHVVAMEYQENINEMPTAD